MPHRKSLLDVCGSEARLSVGKNWHEVRVTKQMCEVGVKVALAIPNGATFFSYLLCRAPNSNRRRHGRRRRLELTYTLMVHNLP